MFATLTLRVREGFLPPPPQLLPSEQEKVLRFCTKMHYLDID